MSPITYIVPDEATLLEIAEQAGAEHLHIISNGERTVLSPTILPGWHRLIIKVKTPTKAVIASA